jgi:hypothetical protein
LDRIAGRNILDGERRAASVIVIQVLPVEKLRRSGFDFKIGIESRRNIEIQFVA